MDKMNFVGALSGAWFVDHVMHGILCWALDLKTQFTKSCGYIIQLDEFIICFPWPNIVSFWPQSFWKDAC